MSRATHSLALLGLIAISLNVVMAVQPLSGFSGAELTFFGGAPDGMDPSSPSYGTSVGSCGYGTVPKDAFPYFSTAAFGPDNQFYKAGPLNACGQCFQLQCDDPRSGACKTDGSGKPLSVLVMITDSCPECAGDHIDVQALAFSKIAKSELGRIKIQYRRVECAVPGDLKVSVMDFAGAGGWIRLAVDDTGGRGAVKQLYVKGSKDSSWQSMKNTWGAAWETSSSPAPPLDFKFVCDDGEEVLAEDVVKQNGGISGGLKDPVIFSTGQQFSINDPAVQQVQAFDGNQDPMLITSDTPGNTGGGSTSSSSEKKEASSSSSSSCTDQAPPGTSFSCQQQKDYGKCSEGFMANYCNKTCGRCSSTSGRKLLSRRLAMPN